MKANRMGIYIILEDMIDKKWWAEDFRFHTLDEAVAGAKKRAFKDRKDYYVAELVNFVELNPDVDTKSTVITADETKRIEDGSV